MYYQAIHTSIVGDREFELASCWQGGEPFHYEVRVTDPDPTERYDGIGRGQFRTESYDEAQCVFALLTETARHFRRLAVEAAAEAERENRTVEVK
jgi:hypothetical protein